MITYVFKFNMVFLFLLFILKANNGAHQILTKIFFLNSLESSSWIQNQLVPKYQIYYILILNMFKYEIDLRGRF